MPNLQNIQTHCDAGARLRSDRDDSWAATGSILLNGIQLPSLCQFFPYFCFSCSRYKLPDSTDLCRLEPPTRFFDGLVPSLFPSGEKKRRRRPRRATQDKDRNWRLSRSALHLKKDEISCVCVDERERWRGVGLRGDLMHPQ